MTRFEDIVWSASAIKTLQTCPQLWYNKYVMGYEPVVQDAADANYGKIFHAAIETKHDYELFKDADLPKTWALEGQLLVQSHAYYCGDIYLKIHEHEWEQVYTGHKFRGIIDGFGVYRNKKIAYELKTTRGVVDDMYWERLKLNFQLRLYADVVRKQYPDVQGFVYNVVKRPMRRPKRGEDMLAFEERVATYIDENKDEVFFTRYFDIDDIAYPDDDISHWLTLAQYTYLDGRGDDLVARNDDSCYKYRRLCEYHPVCTNETDLKNEALYQVRTRR